MGPSVPLIWLACAPGSRRIDEEVSLLGIVLGGKDGDGGRGDKAAEPMQVGHPRSLGLWRCGRRKMVIILS